jgi:hypothetical protein
MKCKIFGLLIFFINFSCTDPDLCEHVSKKDKRSKNEFLSGTFNEKTWDMLAKPYLYSNNGLSNFIFFDTKEYDCQEEVFNISLVFDKIQLGEINIRSISTDQLKLRNGDYESLSSSIDSLDTKFDNKIVFTDISSINLVKGYFQARMYRSKSRRSPGTTDEQNLYVLKSCQFSAIISN